MKNLNQLIILSVWIIIGCSNTLLAQDSSKTMPKFCGFDCCRPDGHAPLGVMTDHIHAKGEWTVSYIYWNADFQGNRSGTSKVSDNTVYTNYLMSPQKMSMQMNMLMLMYGISNRLNVMGMISYDVNNMSMNMNTAQTNMADMPGMKGMDLNSSTMNSRSAGFGDSRVYLTYKLMEQKSQRVIVTMGVSVPTGSITQTGNDFYGNILSYNMQLGTGSFSALPAITYIGQSSSLGWGVRANADIKLNTNVDGYRWGNVFDPTAWVSYKFFSMLSGSIRVEDALTGKMTGSDPALQNNLIAYGINDHKAYVTDPTAVAANYGGQVVNTYAGLNFYFDKTKLKDNRLSIEYGLPVYQKLNGLQIATHATLLAGWLYTF